MPEPVVTSLAAAALFEPSVKALAQLVTALKEPLGKRKVEEMRKELALAFEGLSTVVSETAPVVERLAVENAELRRTVEAYAERLTAQDLKIEAISARIDYLLLPFWRRIFTRFPS